MALRVTKEAIEVLEKRGDLATIEPGYLPELVDFFLHNWDGGATVESSWLTDVTVAFSQAEERRGLVDRPTRSIGVHLVGFGRDESARMWNALLRHAHQELLIPLYTDKAKLTAPVSVATITCDARYRRFFPGGRAIVHDWADKRPTNIEIFQIASVTPSTITATAALGAHPAGARVIPLIQTSVELDGSARLLSDFHQDVNLTLDEVVGAGGLSPWLPTWDNPPWPTYRQIPIVTLGMDWPNGVTATVRRAGERTAEGRGTITSRFGDRPRIGFDFALTGKTREKAFEILRFVDSRRGRLRSMWIVSPQKLWEIRSLAANAIEITPTGSLADLRRFFEFIAIGYRDGTVIIRGIDDAIDVGGSRFITPSESLATSRLDPADVRFVTSAHLVRFNSDGYREKWQSDELMSVDVSTIEVLRDRSWPIELFSDPMPVLQPDGLRDLHLWLESPNGMKDPGGLVVSTTGQDVATWKDLRVDQTRGLESPVPPLEQRHAYLATGALVLRARTYPGAGPFLKGELRTDTDEPIFSNALGMTIFMVAQRRTTETYPMGDDFLVSYKDGAAAGPDALLWTPTLVRFYEDSGVVDPDLSIVTADILYPRAVPHVVCLTWKPGFYAKVYQDGQIRGEAPRAAIDIPVFTGDRARARVFRFANNAGDAASADDTWLDAVVVYRRALELSEINGIGQYLAGVIGTTWRKVT